jgi:hypothetical protein
MQAFVNQNPIPYYAPIPNHMKDKFSIITPGPQQSSNATGGKVVPNNATSNTVDLNSGFVNPVNNNTLASTRNSNSDFLT